MLRCRNRLPILVAYTASRAIISGVQRAAAATDYADRCASLEAKSRRSAAIARLQATDNAAAQRHTLQCECSNHAAAER